ncbi:hypothetical protein [Rhodanobacter sp. MP7CTX1]|uniref:hypothetical protein n=1 Tax=Rhodanobacter sp. MP7CTX1 TaxID=2723084 RepID=UPI0016118BEC|nr:hypothetical protein [Rhodanobacter sp. MP7CTX1]MBB6186917.1 hypothetical protein [Rhodanobacter sp. MP7CTX1]
MTFRKSLYLPCALVVAGLFVSGGLARAANTSLPDFNGVWRLDQLHSDDVSVIGARLRAEKRREQPAVQPAAATSTAAPAASQASGQHGGHGGGMGGSGMGGGGMGGSHGGGHGHKSSTASDNDSDTAASNDSPPPLLNVDSLLNVQQDEHSVQVALANSNRLDARLDGITHESLNGNAMVRSQLTADGLQISMEFDGGIRLEQSWVRSPDGHQLTVTEQWTPPSVKQPITFTRNYVRLDI